MRSFAAASSSFSVARRWVVMVLFFLSIIGHNLARIGDTDRGYAGASAADIDYEDDADPVADAKASNDPEADVDYDTAEEARRSEEEMVAGYHARGYTWPPKDESYSPNTPGWKRLIGDRILQIERDLPGGSDMRFEACVQAAFAGILSKNYTQLGFGLARTDSGLVDEIKAAIRHALETGEGLREEAHDEVIPGPHDPWFVDRPDLTERVLHEVHPFVEAWSGVQVVPYVAYGFRLYRNESALYMHLDESRTHILSVILHLDSSDDAEPWPIVIEDFEGNTHEVTLTSGDILFYESSKCFHGRPRPFRGTWYSSVFVHFYPKNPLFEGDPILESQYAIPPHWNAPYTPPADVPSADKYIDDPQNPGSRLLPRLGVVDTSMRHPDCPGNWCVYPGTLKQWSGPGIPGSWISPDQKVHPLDLESAIRSLEERAEEEEWEDEAEEEL